MVLLMAIVFAFPAAITMKLKHSGEDMFRATHHLQAVIAQVTIQELIEYQMLHGSKTPEEARQKLAASREIAAEKLGMAASLGLPADSVRRIEAVTLDFSQKIDILRQLIESGRPQEAAEFDETDVDPVFDKAEALLMSQAEQMDRRAETTQRYSDLGILVTVLLFLILVSVVQSRRRRANVRSQAQQQGEARYRTLIDQSSDLVAVMDRTGLATYVSPSVERLLELDRTDSGSPTAPERTNAPPIDLVAAVDPLDRARFCEVVQTAAPGSMTSGEFSLVGPRATSTFEVLVQDLTADPSVRGLVLTGHDVTERIELHREMEYRVLHDALTGLPNRTLLADRFEHALSIADRSGTKVGLLLLDLDRFKEVNDTFGHHYGDELLRQVGPRLVGLVRGVDTVARLGGDEFAVLLMDVQGVADAIEVAGALLTALSEPFHVEDVDLDMEASVGVVISGEHGHDLVTLMKHADIAMYTAKRQHLGVFAYDLRVAEHSPTKVAVVGDLRRAIERDRAR